MLIGRKKEYYYFFMREYFIIPCIDIYNIVSKKNTIKTAHSKVTFYYDLQEVLCYLGIKEVLSALLSKSGLNCVSLRSPGKGKKKYFYSIWAFSWF